MEKKILLPGKIRITAIGAYINEFLTELIRSGIKSHKIVNQKGVIYFSIRRIDYKKVAKIAKKHHIKVRVYNKNKVINLQITGNNHIRITKVVGYSDDMIKYINADEVKY